MDPLESIRARLRAAPDPLALLEGIFAAAPFGLQIYEAGGRSLLVNDAFRRLFGAEPPPEYNVLQDEIAARNGVLDLIHRAFAGETVHIPPLWYDPRELSQVTVREGRRAAMDATFLPIRDAGGAVSHVAIVFRDFTEEMLAKESIEEARRDLEARIEERTTELSARVVEHERTLKELKRREVQLGAAQRLTGVGSWEWEIASGAVSWSEELFRIFGVDPHWFVPSLESSLEHVHPDDRAHVREQLERAVRTESPLDYEHRIVRPDGSVRIVHARGDFLRDEGGRPVMIVGTAQDVTDRREAEEQRARLMHAEAARAAAEEASERLSFLAEASKVLASSLDYEATLRNILGLALPRLGDFGFFDVVESEDRVRRVAGAHGDPALQATLAQTQWRRSPRTDINLCALSSGRTALHEKADDAWLEAIADGPEHLAFMKALSFRSMLTVPLLYQQRCLGALTLFRRRSRPGHSRGDVPLAEELAVRAASAVENARLYRDLKASEARAQSAVEAANEAHRRKDEFLAVLGHELRNPLAPILSAVQLLQLKGAAQPEVGVIERQARHIARLVDDLLDVSRITQGRIELRPEPVAVGEVMAEVLEASRSAIEARGLHASLEIASEDVVVEADRVRLAQVILNILGNALRFTPAGGRIELRAEASAAEARIVVRDTGIGIRPELLPRIFDPFVQGERTLERSAGGVGLGLAIVRSLVELHGGEVTANRAGPGQGTEIVVRLPRQFRGAVAGKPEPAPAVVSSRRGRRVLVVDDNRDAADLLGHALQLAGHEVRVADGGPAALQEAAGFKPEIAILDIGLPGMDGYELASRLRAEHGRALRLVAVSGFGQDHDRRRSKEAGFEEHLVKPVDLDRVYAIVSAEAKSPTYR